MAESKYSKEVLALALARESVAALRRAQDGSNIPESVIHLLDAFDALDNVGVFSSVDRQTDYTAAADILAANASDRFVSPRGLAHSQVRHPAGQGLPVTPESSALDAAEWADTTRADMARHQGVSVTEVQDSTIIQFSDSASQELGDLIRGTDDTEDGRF